MRRICLLVLIFASAALAQGPQWRVTTGDDPKFAQPDFDDSAWAASPGPELSHESGFVPGVRWYRRTFRLQPDWAGQELALGFTPLDDAYQVFVDGIRIGDFGVWEGETRFYLQRHLAFPVPRRLTGGDRIHVAVRRWNWKAQTNTFLVHQGSGSSYFPHAVMLGPSDLVKATEKKHILEGLVANLPALTIVLFLTLCGALSLALYREQPNQVEYLWVGVLFLLLGLPRLLGLPFGWSLTPMNSVIGFSLLSYNPIVRLAEGFFLGELAPSIRKLLRAAGWFMCIITAVHVGATAWGNLPLQQMSAPFASRALNQVTAGASLLAVIACLRKKRAEGFVLAAGLLLRVATNFFRYEITALLGGDAGMGVSRIPVGSLLIDIRDAGNAVFALILMGVLWSRYRKEQHRMAVVTGELAAAKEVQELMLQTDAATPGFAVDAVYRPAQDVGGDFYQVWPGEDGTLLVVVGDVSGKGLKAAMMVASVVGAIRNERDRSPGALLEYLNRSITGHTGGGFVTCCVLRWERDGGVTVANAGHLAPYLGGRELDVESGLPLGVADGTTYAETRMSVGGQTMMILSDGVVEAANAKGDLFGFERTREISGKSAQMIATAAQAWGQNDDITVVTVRRVA